MINTKHAVLKGLTHKLCDTDLYHAIVPYCATFYGYYHDINH